MPQVLPWAYVACGLDGVIRHANRHMGKLLGVEAAVLAGQDFAHLFKVDDGNGGSLGNVLAKIAPGRAWHGRLSYPTGGDRVAMEVVVEADPPGVFDAAALAAIRRWRYYPIVNGEAVERKGVQTEIRFELTDPRPPLPQEPERP